jgi:NADH-quinone oxidoreductase subunit J
MAFAAFCIFSLLLVISSAMVVFLKNHVHSVLCLIVAFFNGAAIFLLMGAEFLSMLLVIVYVGAVAVLFLFVVMMLDVKPSVKSSGVFAHIRPAFIELSRIALYLLIFTVVFGGLGFFIHESSFFADYKKDTQALLILASILFFISRYVAHKLSRVYMFDSVKSLLNLVSIPFVLICILIAEVSILIVMHKGNLVDTSFVNIVRSFDGNNTRNLAMLLFSSYLLPFLLSGFILLVAMIGAIILTISPRVDAKRQSIGLQVNRSKDDSITLQNPGLREGVDIGGGLS